MTVIQFLTAQLDQEEALARAATLGPWEAFAVGRAGMHIVRPVGDCEWVSQVNRRDRAEQEADASHIARHDPARALREVRAKRAIVARAQDGSLGGQAAQDILDHLASVYADHPDYQQNCHPQHHNDSMPVARNQSAGTPSATPLEPPDDQPDETEPRRHQADREGDPAGRQVSRNQ